MQQIRTSLITLRGAAKRASLVIAAATMSVASVSANIASAQEASPSQEIAFGAPSAGEMFSNWVARNMLVVAGNNPDSPLYWTPKGIGYEGVAALFVERSDGNFLCTGSLLQGGNNILTAAHCLANEFGVNVTNKVTAVFFPAGQPVAATELIVSAGTYVNPAYTGEVIDAHDIAIVTLDALPSQSIRNAAYSLFTGNPFQIGEIVGSGDTGTGNTGSIDQTGGFGLRDRRSGLNTMDFTWSDPRFNGFFFDFFGSADPTTIVADFDDGTLAHDASCQLTTLSFFNFGLGKCGFGLGRLEAMLGPGDSGGPLFINGGIAGVASYGLTFGSGLSDIDDEQNSTFGEFGGWTSTRYNAEWIQHIQTTVPEPSSFVLMGAGLISLVGFAKRRNRIS